MPTLVIYNRKKSYYDDNISAPFFAEKTGSFQFTNTNSTSVFPETGYNRNQYIFNYEIDDGNVKEELTDTLKQAIITNDSVSKLAQVASFANTVPRHAIDFGSLSVAAVKVEDILNSLQNSREKYLRFVDDVNTIEKLVQYKIGDLKTDFYDKHYDIKPYSEKDLGDLLYDRWDTLKAFVGNFGDIWDRILENKVGTGVTAVLIFFFPEAAIVSAIMSYISYDTVYQQNKIEGHDTRTAAYRASFQAWDTWETQMIVNSLLQITDFGFSKIGVFKKSAGTKINNFIKFGSISAITNTPISVLCEVVFDVPAFLRGDKAVRDVDWKDIGKAILITSVTSFLTGGFIAADKYRIQENLDDEFYRINNEINNGPKKGSPYEIYTKNRLDYTFPDSVNNLQIYTRSSKNGTTTILDVVQTKKSNPSQVVKIYEVKATDTAPLRPSQIEAGFPTGKLEQNLQVYGPKSTQKLGKDITIQEGIPASLLRPNNFTKDVGVRILDDNITIPRVLKTMNKQRGTDLMFVSHFTKDNFQEVVKVMKSGKSVLPKSIHNSRFYNIESRLGNVMGETENHKQVNHNRVELSIDGLNLMQKNVYFSGIR